MAEQIKSSRIDIQRNDMVEQLHRPIQWINIHYRF